MLPSDCFEGDVFCVMMILMMKMMYLSAPGAVCCMGFRRVVSISGALLRSDANNQLGTAIWVSLIHCVTSE